MRSRHSAAAAASAAVGGTPYPFAHPSYRDDGYDRHTPVVNSSNAIHDDNIGINDNAKSGHGGYRVYRRRWIMLFYLSLLNLLSDWTGLSVAPIATITSRAYSSDDDYIYSHDNDAQIYIQPEALVTCFLVASCLGTALEPWILSRLGLRRTIVFGAFNNMLGNLVKSGGLPPFFSISSLLHGMCGTFALYLGFFLVGFANPLFQCTPALLSASWFPEHERTMATSIALNANQLGVGLAFIVGALYVQSPNQIANYFSLLTFFSVAAFLGTAMQLEDAPPTPPSGSSRIMRGTLEVSIRDIIQRASSSLLVKDGTNNGGGRTDDPADSSGFWNFSGEEDGEVGASNNTTARTSRSGMNTPAQLISHRHDSTPQSTSSSSPDYPAQLALFSPYSADESDINDCEGAEPTLTQTPHHLEIDIRDDQIFLAAKACFHRKGFSHCLVAFSCVGIVINVLSTYLDYLVRGDYHSTDEMNASINQSGELSTASIYVAVIGAVFQVIIMISSVIVGFFTDRTRSYYVVTLILLVLGVFALAECGVSLDTHRAGDVRWSLLVVSGLLGPLLPLATELTVELAYPLSENTVLVILQLSCNLLSALFIPLFKIVSNVGVSTNATTSGNNDGANNDDGTANILGNGRPPYTFSFYLLIVITSVSTVYFSTFDGKYLRYEADLAKNRRDFPARHSLPPIL
jgi:MFS family permease